MRRFILVCAVLAASCGQAPQQDNARPAPEVTTPPALSELSPRDALLDCAGAIVAQAGLDPMADPSLDTPEENVYFTVLALMDKEPGLEGQAGRQAAATSRDGWAQRSANQRTARASECTTRFGG